MLTEYYMLKENVVPRSVNGFFLKGLMEIQMQITTLNQNRRRNQ